MAKILPSLESFRPASAGEYAELACIRMLGEKLPASYTVFHHLDCYTTKDAQDHFGELDIVVSTPAGRVVCLELKAGDVDFSAHGVHKTYGGTSKDVVAQARRQHAALLTSLRSAGLHHQVSHFLVLPQHKVSGEGTLAYPRERIIDASDYPGLPGRLMHLDYNTPAVAEAQRHQLEAHLANRFRVARDVDATDEAESAAVRQLSDGLAQWVRRIESPSGYYLIEATAGSGKTQLALSLLNDAAARGERALYVCFNRMLAERVSRLGPPGATVDTFHQLCRDAVEQEQGETDFSTPGIFDTLAARFGEIVAASEGRYDCVIIDEAQDFATDWIETVHGMGTGEHRLYVLKDDNQNLYGREAFELAGATVIRSDDNFRTPRKLAETINLLRLTERPIRACAPHAGEAPDFLRYRSGSADSLLRSTAQAIHNCIGLGYRPDQIVILSFVGLDRSTVLAQEALARLPLKRFIGHDRNGQSCWSAGELTADSVFRFKGRSAAAVILTEVDFAQLNDRYRKRLFVAMTRARRHLSVVISDAAEAAIIAELNRNTHPTPDARPHTKAPQPA